MKRLLRLTALALGLTLLLSACGHKNTEPERKDAATQTVPVEGITGLTLCDGDVTLRFEKDEEGSWIWHDDPTFPLEQSAMDELLALPAALDGGETVTDGQELSVYGLETPAKYITVTADGVLRAPIAAGDITTPMAFDVLSMGVGEDGTSGFPLVDVYLTGKELKAVLEVDASVTPIMNAAQLYINGIDYSFDTHRMFFNRVYKALLTEETVEQDGKETHIERTLTEIDDDKLYRVVTGMYSAQMLGTVKSKSMGLLSLVPKDENGNEITDFSTRVLKDKNGNEIKEWYALAAYLKTFGQSGVPAKYHDPDVCGTKRVSSSWNPIQLLRSPNYDLKKKDTPNIYFIGNGLSSDALTEVMEMVDGVDFSVNVISKSGTTTEPAVAFRFFRELLEERYGPEEAARRIYATTDRRKGALKALADQAGYETFVVPDDIGGRYSVLTAVGLLPIAVAGIDIEALMAGAREMMDSCTAAEMDANPAWQYAGARYEMYRTGKKIEILAAYEPCFRFMAEWWKQLYGESEGKEHKGLFPASVEFTADLHSMGQYIQQGERSLFETVVRFGASHRPQVVPLDETDGDGLNFLAGKDVDFIRTQAMDGTLLAHVEGGVPNIILRTGQINAFTLGELIYFFEYACGLSGYLLDVNPFDQPGVEAYKKNMFALLGKPGYEELRSELLRKLEK